MQPLFDIIKRGFLWRVIRSYFRTPNCQWGRSSVLAHSLALMATLLGQQPGYAQGKQAPAPNIVFILADDLGYGELGVYGQSIIETPNLDKLAARGMRFSQFYSGSAVCAPARCVLLTGKHSGHAYIRGNDEWAERGEVWDFAKAAEDPNLEGQRPLPDSIQTLGEVLRQSGYQTACVGKWGLGAPLSEGRPNAQGFDFFYGYNCQRQAHNLYPPYQWRNMEKERTANPVFLPNAKLSPSDNPDDPATYARFQASDYAPALQLQEARGFIQRASKEAPFFLLYTSPLPHVALQAPPDLVAYYQRKIGPEKPYLGEKGYLPVLAPRATYAAMIHTLDAQVGAIVATLEQQGILDNTLIVFTSDNGPSYAGGVDAAFFQSAGPFDSQEGKGKGFLYEGGIRVPFIAAWPGHIPEGTQSDCLAALWDIFPTLETVAKGRPAATADGRNLLPILTGKKNSLSRQYLYWEFPEYGGQQAVRMGDWKALRLQMQSGQKETLLFNLHSDLRETTNVAAQFPAVVKQLEAIMVKEHLPSDIPRFQIKALDQN